MATDRRESDPALEAASARYGAAQSGEGVLRRHRGKVGLAVGLAVGLLYSPQCQVTVTGSGQPEPAQRGFEASEQGGDPQARAQILGVLACKFDENGEPICIPLPPEMLDELGEGCEPPEDEIPPECLPGTPQQFVDPGQSPHFSAEVKPELQL